MDCHIEYQVGELFRILEFEHEGRLHIMLDINTRLKSIFPNVSDFFSISEKSGDNGIYSFTLYFFIEDEQITVTVNDESFESAQRKAQENLLISILSHCKYGMEFNSILTQMIEEILIDRKSDTNQSKLDSLENFEQKKWDCFLILNQILQRDFPFCEVILYKPNDVSQEYYNKILAIYIVKPITDINGQVINDKELLKDILTTLQEKSEISWLELSDFPSLQGNLVRTKMNFDIKVTDTFITNSLKATS